MKKFKLFRHEFQIHVELEVGLALEVASGVALQG